MHLPSLNVDSDLKKIGYFTYWELLQSSGYENKSFQLS